MAKRQPTRRYPNVWDHSEWEEAQWHPERTYGPLLELIRSVATKHGREAFARETVDLPFAIQMPFAVDAQGQVTFGELETRGSRAVALTLSVQRVIRKLMREEAARLISQVDVPEVNGTVRRTIIIRWDRQKRRVADQIKKLHRAVLSENQFAIEVAWFGLTRRAHEYLSAGYHLACHRGAIDGYTGDLEAPAKIIPVPMLAPQLLKIILPFAILVVRKQGRRPVHPRDEALAEVLGIFNELSDTCTGSARRGDHHEPAGPGADFVRQIETLFSIELMAKGSTHAVARAKRRIAKRRD